MKSNIGAKTPRLPGGDDSLEQISTVIILDTFILALFSIVMLATALVSITTHNGLLNSASSSRSDGEQDPKDMIAMVEKRSLEASPCADQVARFVSPEHPGTVDGSVPQDVLADSEMFTYQRPTPTRLFGRPPASQVGSLEKFTGGIRGGRAGSPERVLHELAAPVPLEREIKDSTAVGGSDPWNAGDFYDGYGISTIINP